MPPPPPSPWVALGAQLGAQLIEQGLPLAAGVLKEQIAPAPPHPTAAPPDFRRLVTDAARAVGGTVTWVDPHLAAVAVPSRHGPHRVVVTGGDWVMAQVKTRACYRCGAVPDGMALWLLSRNARVRHGGWVMLEQDGGQTFIPSAARPAAGMTADDLALDIDVVTGEANELYTRLGL